MQRHARLVINNKSNDYMSSHVKIETILIFVNKYFFINFSRNNRNKVKVEVINKIC